MILRELLERLNRIKDQHGEEMTVLLDCEQWDIETNIQNVRYVNNGISELYLTGY